MAYDIVHSQSAEFDFGDIIDYITVHLNNPTAASTLLDEYEDRLATIRQSPRVYRLAHVERLARKGYHTFDFGTYTAFYMIDYAEQKVLILRIFYKK